MVTTRGRVALAAGAGARWASRVTGRGAGAMIGGLVAMTLDKSILRQLGEGRRTVVVTGHERQVDHHPDDRGGAGAHARTTSPPTPRARTWTPGWWRRWRALATRRWPRWRSTRCTCRTSPTPVDPAVIVLLNLSRDQLDRVGEINHIERTLRGGLARHPSTRRGRQLR